MGKVTVVGGKVGMEAPISGILLSTIAEGSIVKLNENGKSVEFYVAKHNYEPTLNGSGRTLLVRKDGHSAQPWDSDNTDAYSESDIDAWMNGAYKNTLDADVQSAIEATNFYFNPYKMGASSTVTTLSRGIFLLSLTELGLSSSYASVEGSVLPSASVFGTMLVNGVANHQWTRTPSTKSTAHVCSVFKGSASSTTKNTENIYARPCFTLPNTAIFDGKTMILKGVK